ncbi:hypothetical protein D3C81_1632990 [compost metagenome]
MGDIEGKRPDCPQVPGDADGAGGVALAGHQAAIQGGIPDHAQCHCSLPQQRVIMALGRVVAAQRGAVAPDPGTKQVGNAGIGLDEPPHLAIGFGQYHLQLARGAHVQVVDSVRARADIR